MYNGTPFEWQVRYEVVKSLHFSDDFVKGCSKTAVEQETRIFREPLKRMESLKLGDFWDLRVMRAGTKKTVSTCRHEFWELPLSYSRSEEKH